LVIYFKEVFIWHVQNIAVCDTTTVVVPEMLCAEELHFKWCPCGCGKREGASTGQLYLAFFTKQRPQYWDKYMEFNVLCMECTVGNTEWSENLASVCTNKNDKETCMKPSFSNQY
jgi:hypothetical protein